VVTGQRRVSVQGRRLAASDEARAVEDLVELEADLARVYDVRRAQDWEALMRARAAGERR
jgi:hypothetical protein